MIRLAESSDAVSAGSERVVADSAIGLSLAIRLAEPSNGVSVGAECVAADCVVSGVGSAPVERVIG